MPDGRLLIRYGRRSCGAIRAISEDILALTRQCTAILEAEIAVTPILAVDAPSLAHPAAGRAPGRDEPARAPWRGRRRDPRGDLPGSDGTICEEVG